MKNKLFSHGRILGLLAVILMVAVSCEDNYLPNTFHEPMVEARVVSVSPPVSPSYCGDAQVSTLFAGQHIEAGTVTVGNDEDFLYVTYSSNVLIDEVHLFVTESPLTSRMAPGRAPFKALVGDYTFTFAISFDELGVNCGDVVYLQAHAALENGETAYGGDITLPNRGSWFGTITYSVACCDDVPWNFPVWTQSISHVILVFETSSGCYSVKVDEFPSGYYNINLLIDDILAYLGYDASSLQGLVIKGGNQPAKYFNSYGDEDSLPSCVGFWLGGQNVENPSAIDYTVDFGDIF